MRSSRTSRPQHGTRKKFSYEVPCALFFLSGLADENREIEQEEKTARSRKLFPCDSTLSGARQGCMFGGKVSEGMQGHHAVLSALQMDRCVSVFAVPRSVLGCLIDRLFLSKDRRIPIVPLLYSVYMCRHN
ncbi:hypothetical protein BDV41DRAFT_519985 [Aspergillus transmontanensis]|uniref:Uncharacterized protein n=1 Tax=Aspergillus transmontanensis TaxID=1034304 RepID=A0A5N6WF39_9EURO|nr:hypothetical protein BDV41DRAFT_519985 [Aspergillus transmontanensis]